MSLRRIVIVALAVGALGLGLAGCGGGGGSSGTGSTGLAVQRAAVASAIETARVAVVALGGVATSNLLAAAEAAVADAKDAVADADALSDAEKDAHTTTLSVIEDNLAAARSRFAMSEEERRAAVVREIARLRSAIEGAPISVVSATVEHGAAPILAGTVPGTPPVSGLAAEAVPGSTVSVGGWTGAAYAAADEAAGTADRIVFYSDIEAPGAQPFAGETGKYSTASGLDGDGNLPIIAATDATLIVSAAFPTGPGIRTHEAGSDGIVEIAGSFDGAEGSYVCTSATNNACTSSIRSGGGIALEGGAGWKFVPAPGASVAEPDTEYRYFGWWQRETGESYAIGAFHGGTGGDAGDFADFSRLQGTATYRGPAAGRFLVDPQIGEATAGDFTAAATLEVDFADAAEPGSVTGTVEGFVANGKPEPWSVELGRAALRADGAIAAGATAWSIGAQQGAAAGTPAWSGRFHDVDADKAPQSATGSFTASFGEIGRMIGAFGTTREP